MDEHERKVALEVIAELIAELIARIARLERELEGLKTAIQANKDTWRK